MSGNKDIEMKTLEPANTVPASEPAAGASKSKALRAEGRNQSEGGAGGGGGGVFRLDSLAPGAGQDGASHIPTPATSKISHAAIFFLVLIVVGGALLLVMRKIGINPMSAIAKMQEPDVDLTKNAQGSVDHTRVLRDLSESAVKGQVPIDQVQKNPFEIPEVAMPDTNDPEKARKLAEEKARKELEERMKHLETALGTLKIHSIINGSTPVARINDQAVRVGDKIDDLFVVKSITGRSVELECGDQSWTISLDDNKGPVKKAAKKK